MGQDRQTPHPFRNRRPGSRARSRRSGHGRRFFNEQHEAGGQQAVDASGVEAEVEATAIEYRAQRDIAQPGAHHRHQPEIEHRLLATSPQRNQLLKSHVCFLFACRTAGACRIRRCVRAPGNELVTHAGRPGRCYITARSLGRSGHRDRPAGYPYPPACAARRYRARPCCAAASGRCRR